jgi:beta-glucanase (GH16 family)
MSLFSDKFSLPSNPHEWGAGLTKDFVEADDDMHNPDTAEAPRSTSGPITRRGFTNLGCLFLLLLCLLGLFVGYPVTHYFTKHNQSNLGGFNLGGINATGQVPLMAGNFALIDRDTPQDAYTKASWQDQGEMELVFSDEFNMDGRTFYPGDDPFWEAVDLHYWATNNLEWYDPEAVTTKEGALTITFSEKRNHDLNYQGGLLSTWNKFCFTGGYIETSVVLPGMSNVVGLWPAVWTMGNLGRAGYGASLEGMWPYTYDACDVGTLANQTKDGRPLAATVNGDKGKGGVLSYLPGQRLSRCTCDGENHPGPKHSDGTYVGRGAPEIDIFEAQVSNKVGQVSQSAQWAPFDARYHWNNSTDNLIANPLISKQNSFIGSVTQQATSVVSTTNSKCYEMGGTGCFAIYGFEYKPGFDDAYITWINDNKVAWTMKAGGVGANQLVDISARPVPQEPMYIIANLGMSKGFGDIDFQHLVFPVTMKIDYIRVYQPKGAKNIGCNPKDFPTTDYINANMEAYTNANLTTWSGDYKQPVPKNRLLDQC